MEVKPSENISQPAAAVSDMDCTSGSTVKCTAERKAQNVMLFFLSLVLNSSPDSL